MRIKKGVLVLINSKNLREDVEEIIELSKNINIEIVEYIHQNLNKPDPLTFIGKGKFEDLKELIAFVDAEVLVINSELSPRQYIHISKELNIEVYDRTDVILKIFSEHAETQESKLQIKLATLKHILPRIYGLGSEMSRTGGGIGTRGPGEQEKEYKKRTIKNEISKIQNKLKKIKSQRELTRKNKKDIIKVSIVGYASAGKSTLLKELSHENKIKISEKMFSTLSPKSRRVMLPSGLFVILSDTVGFIRNLPHELIEAFKSTLEEIKYSDLIIHLVDISSQNIEERISTAYDVLENIKALDIPRILVFNKIDKINDEQLSILKNIYKNAIFISCKTGENIENLKKAIQDKLIEEEIIKTFEIEEEYKNVQNWFKKRGKIGIEEIAFNNTDIKLKIYARNGGAL
ncbi:GTP-binding protein HflX [Marinitoga piezophila KA3]|uniref:GTPase HflX n=1 Tax=Marinitoga piezophila (strain DSM 14283 / JCM 11233 / KA3) TaxID=443254 RepID=H2J813_MARPK|nr:MULTISPECIES: GTPase HflX [Marinitoga]AEX85504.1 GTP-binding protein HflX [Marinitoga piezophila KA3]APT75973.1 hypothetical protein LN42_05965 [Marinitoga sp. 1137]